MKSKSVTQQLETSIRFHLNILTPENYEAVKKELLKCAFEGSHGVEKLGDLIIEKAWTEIKYSKIYARLCDYLGKEAGLYFKKQSGKEAHKRNDFKVYILRKIQHSFDNDSVIKPKSSKNFEDMSSEEEDLYLIKKKKLTIGSKLNLLTYSNYNL